MKYLRAFWRWIMRKAEKPAPRASVKRQPKKHYGSHYYLGDLLDRLDEAFIDLKKFRRLDPDAFDAYQRLGATVVSSDGVFGGKLEPYVAKQLPAFGCIHMGQGDTEEYFGLRFGCFVKETRPINVQAANAAIYRVTVTYDVDGVPFGDQFFVCVSGTHVVALKQCTPKMRKFGSNNAIRSKKPNTPVTRMEWGYAGCLERNKDKFGGCVHKAASFLFSYIANAANAREMGLTVRVRKGKLTAAFAIDLLRTPYFFSDREKVVNENGSTKKIIHHVKGHYRTLAGGSKKFIKPHFRGLREFQWNGYDVRVSMAGKHGAALSSFDLATADPMSESPDLLEFAEVAERLDEVMV